MAPGLHNIEPASPPKFTLRKVRQIPELTESDRLRFWAKVDRREDAACWLWTGAGVPNGHGFLALGQRPNCQPYYAHRIVWTIVNGAIPEGIAVLHQCDVRRCCNPAHLFLGSQGDNVRDASRKGHLNVARKRNRTLKPQVIFRYLAGGVTAEVLAAEYGISAMTVHRWIRVATHGADQRFRCGNKPGTNNRRKVA